jgi:glycosyltransferase involved in cell wall biosynthesis
MSDSRIRVVHLITGLHLGGAERMVARLVETMDRSRFESVVISLLPGGVVRGAIERAGVEVHSLDLDNLASSIPGALRLTHELRRIRPHVLQTWLYHADLLGLVVGRAVGVPSILWNVRCTVAQGRGRRLSHLLAALSPYPAGVVVNSLRGQALHQTLGYAPRRWHFIPNGFDTSYFTPRKECRDRIRAELGVPLDALVVGMVARYHPMKDHALFLRAAKQLLRELPNTHFVLAGPGITGTNDALALQIDPSLRNNLSLLGPRSDIPELLSAFDIATLTSTHEGFPNVVGESMACGVPCVVTDAGDAAAIVGSTGWSVPTGDVHALALAWKAALQMSSLARFNLGVAARNRIVEEFAMESVVAQYEALYEGAAGRHGRDRPLSATRSQQSEAETSGSVDIC